MPRAIAQSIFDAALGAVDPRVVVRRVFERDRQLLDSLLDRRGRLIVVGFGKAAVGMAKGICDARVEPDDGIVIVPHYALRPPIQDRVLVSAGGHPTPTEDGRNAARVLKRKVEALTSHDVVIALVSGGGSSLAALPRQDLRLSDLRQTSDLLLRSGLPIESINAVRCRLTVFGGGGLARIAAPARVLTLILSDVADDHAGLVASGPTANVHDLEALQEVLRRVDLIENFPPRVRTKLFQAGTKKRSSVSATNLLVASNADAVRAAIRAGEALGFETTEGAPLEGLASRCGKAVGAAAREDLAHRRVVVQGGETTVRIPSDSRGIGGRSQELALAAALRVEDQRGIAILAAGTDGIDGPTPSAGGLIDGASAERMRAAGVEPELSLRAHNSHIALEASGDLVGNGPTGTNVADLCISVSMGCDA